MTPFSKTFNSPRLGQLVAVLCSLDDMPTMVLYFHPPACGVSQVNVRYNNAPQADAGLENLTLEEFEGLVDQAMRRHEKRVLKEAMKNTQRKLGAPSRLN